MASRGETVIEAIKALIEAAVPAAEVHRNLDAPVRIGAGGLIVVRDGDPGDPEMTMSPLAYTYAHAVRIEVAVQGETIAARIAALDAVLIPIGEAVEADRTLGGLCEWLEPTAADRNDLRTEGAATQRWADFDLVATYSTTNPLT